MNDILTEARVGPYRTGDLLAFVAATLMSLGVPDGPAHDVAEVLADAEAGGNVTHGMIHLPRYVRRIRNGAVDPRARPAIVRDRGPVVVLDGGNGLGQVAAIEATRQVIARAARFGIAQVILLGATTFGPAGFYARRIAEAGAVGLVLGNSSDNTAPLGGTTPTMSNSPFAIGIPCTPHPVVADMACSQVARGTVHLAQLAGRRLPPGVALDRWGRPTEDPAAAMDGALLPFGGHKGFALGFVFDVMMSAYAAGSATRPPSDVTGVARTQVFVAWDVAPIDNGGEYARRVRARLESILSSPPMEGAEPPRAPGAASAARRARAAQQGIWLVAEVRDELTAIADEQGIAFPEPIPHAT